MTHAIFVVPYAMETTLRFVHAAASLPGVRLGVISQESPERLPPEIRQRLAAHTRVENAHDARELSQAVRSIARQWGGRVDRLIGILEQLQETLASVRAELGIEGMSPEVALNFRDKSRMKDLLRANDLPCARHGLATTAEQALSVAESIGYPLVAKPPAGAGAKNTMRVESREELEGYLRTVPPRDSEPLLLEEFIIGKEHSLDSVTVGGVPVFHSISRYYPTPLEVMETPWMQWCVLLPREVGAEFDDIRAAGSKALGVLGLQTGLTHMEWFRREDDSIAISEVAARPPGAQFTTLLSYAHDRDFYASWAQIVLQDQFEPPARQYATGAAYLRGQGRGEVVRIDGIEEAQRDLGDLVVEARLPRVGQPQSQSYEGEGFVILRDMDTQRVEEGLRKIVSSIQVVLG